ncbi:hypothetical protein RJT34_32534 [Clitoria ternatea]|uniref:Uncharacterized protein n=1 Tax=Clitoria ternatea TaxID=43366 RepID=A0AAN9EX61_CLITE
MIFIFYLNLMTLSRSGLADRYVDLRIQSFISEDKVPKAHGVINVGFYSRIYPDFFSRSVYLPVAVVPPLPQDVFSVGATLVDELSKVKATRDRFHQLFNKTLSSWKAMVLMDSFSCNVTMEYYGGMIDLLVRVGSQEEIKEVLDEMHMHPDVGLMCRMIDAYTEEETSEFVADKVTYAFSQGLKVIACIGETLEQGETSIIGAVVAKQTKATGAKISNWDNVVSVYEPIWAIRTGKVKTCAHAQEVHVD